jgi:hypothetical protein
MTDAGAVDFRSPSQHRVQDNASACLNYRLKALEMPHDPRKFHSRLIFNEDAMLSDLRNDRSGSISSLL